MTFITIFVAMLIERFFDCTHLRSMQWYASYEHLLTKHCSFATKLPFLLLGILVIPLPIIVCLLDFSMHGWLYGLVRFIFDVLVILYCLGPQNFWADTRISIQHFFVEANRRVFALVFWFTILGPFGAVLYRMVTLTSNQAEDDRLKAQAATLEAVLDWLPVRLLSFIFALGGHFSQVFRCFRQNVLLGLSHNNTMLTECGDAAIADDKPDKRAEENVSEKSAVNLLDRSLVILLAIVALKTLLV